MNRRSFLVALGSIPGLGWVEPAEIGPSKNSLPIFEPLPTPPQPDPNGEVRWLKISRVSRVDYAGSHIYVNGELRVLPASIKPGDVIALPKIPENER